MSQRGDFSKKKIYHAFAVMVSSSEWLIGVVTNERHDFSLATPLPNQMNHFFIGEIKVGILIALKQGNGATVNLATRGWMKTRVVQLKNIILVVYLIGIYSPNVPHR
jgi:hypothetical protein